jgi:hypothetical protein
LARADLRDSDSFFENKMESDEEQSCGVYRMTRTPGRYLLAAANRAAGAGGVIRGRLAKEQAKTSSPAFVAMSGLSSIARSP